MTDLEIKQGIPVPTDADDIRQYMRDVRSFDVLSPEQEQKLAEKCAAGDEDAIRQMVTANLRLVVSIAREYSGRGVDLPDLIQEGSIGLLIAARKFNSELNFRFSTYASKWIRQGVTRCLLNHGGVIRVPLHTAEKMQKIVRVRSELRAENGTEPSADEIAARVELPVDRVEDLIALDPAVFSIDQPAGEQENETIGALMEDSGSSQPEDELIRRELEEILERLMNSLNEREQRILRLRFGMEDGKYRSLAEIAGEIGVSKERVRQLEKQALDRLMRLGTSIGLEDFLE